MQTNEINQYNEAGNKHGYWEEELDKGQIKYKIYGMYVDGEKNGSWTIYNLNQNYKHGEEYFQSGLVTSYTTLYDNGNVLFFSDNKEQRRYDRDGTLLYHLDKLTNLQTEYYPNGNIKHTYFYKFNKNHEIDLSGWSEEFHENGNPKSRGMFKKTVKHGYWENFNEQGQLIASGEFINGKPVGRFSYYYSTGEEYRAVLYDEESRFISSGFLKVTIINHQHYFIKDTQL